MRVALAGFVIAALGQSRWFCHNTATTNLFVRDTRQESMKAICIFEKSSTTAGLRQLSPSDPRASSTRRFLRGSLILVLLLGGVSQARSAYIYFSEGPGGRISRANLDGTGKVTLASGLSVPIGPTLDLARGQMYWGELATATMRRANLDGTGRTNLISGPNGGSPALDLAGGRMYWNVASSGNMRRANLDGSDQQVLISGLNDPHAPVLDLVGGKIYWANFGNGDVRRANLDGTGQETLVPGLASSSLLALDVAGGKMYWTVQRANGDIRRANLDGTGQEILVRNQNSPAGIALDLNQGHLYWANFGGGDIRRANLDGSGETILVTGLSGPVMVSLDIISDGPASIQIPPRSQPAPAGANVALAVGAAGAKPLFHQWYFNGAPLPGATNATLTFGNAVFEHSGDYYAVVTNALGLATSPTARLDVLPLFITSQTPNTNVWRGSNVNFRVAITSTVPTSCQWRFNGANLIGATDLALSLTNIQMTHEGEYTAVLVNGFGSVTSAVTRLSVLVRPEIVQPPLSQSVVAGGSVTLSVDIRGNPAPFGFQWRRSSTILTNIVLSDRTCFLTLTNVQTNQGGTYRVVVTNAASPALTINATFNLTVLADADSDGLPDDWESAHGFNTNDGADAMADADGDGQSNREEYVTGTNPTNALSTLRIEAIAPGDGFKDVALQFFAVSNRTYTVQSRGTVDSGIWSRAADIIATSTNRMVEISDPVSAPPGEQKFYRVVTPRIP